MGRGGSGGRVGGRGSLPGDRVTSRSGVKVWLRVRLAKAIATNHVPVSLAENKPVSVTTGWR